MQRLSLIDDAFLRIESRRQPFHIAMLMLFDPGEDAPADLVDQIVQKMKASTVVSEPFNRRLVSKRGLHYWKEDSQFDITHHFAHMSLPKPGRIRELLEFVSRVHASHLDRAYPLWRLYLIEGIEDGRFAIYLKVHHSMMDGVAGIRNLISSMSYDKETSKSLPPFWENKVEKFTNQPIPIPTPAFDTLKAVRAAYRDGLKSFKPIFNEIRSNIKDYREKNPNLVFSGQAPRSLLNGKISASRRFAAQSYSTPRMRGVAKALNTTLNDVVLAMCSSALRQYLLDRNELPDTPLIAGIPVSTRQAGDEKFNNEVSFTLAHLATHLDDPVERLLAIKACMDYNKEHMRGLSPSQTLTSAALKMIPGALNAVLGVNADKVLGNLCISHVPGPKEDIYWQGARMTGLYPVSLVTDGGALNITIISRHDYVDFGLIACSKSVPRVQRLLDYLEDGLTELEQAVAERQSKAAKDKSRTAGTRKPRARKASGKTSSPRDTKTSDQTKASKTAETSVK